MSFLSTSLFSFLAVFSVQYPSYKALYCDGSSHLPAPMRIAMISVDDSSTTVRLDCISSKRVYVQLPAEYILSFKSSGERHFFHQLNGFSESEYGKELHLSRLDSVSFFLKFRPLPSDADSLELIGGMSTYNNFIDIDIHSSHSLHEQTIGEFDFADVYASPSFQGKDAGYFYEWLTLSLSRNWKMKTSFYCGTLYLLLRIDAEGNLSSHVLSATGHEKLDKSVVSALKTSPKWDPARLHGTPVPSRFILPVSFSFKK